MWNVPCAHTGQGSSRPQTVCALAARAGMLESSGPTPSQPPATLHPPRQTSEQRSPSQGREWRPPRPSTCHVPHALSTSQGCACSQPPALCPTEACELMPAVRDSASFPAHVALTRVYKMLMEPTGRLPCSILGFWVK